ncbi:MAG: lipid-binding SYLF domain-containing protein [Pyrinomonadaceae bacterium]
MKNTIRFMTAIMIAVLLTSAAIFAQNKKAAKEMKEASKQAKKAAQAFREISGDADKAIPRELLDRAEAIAVFPSVLKVAFGFGGRGGQGLISRRTATGWSAPAFFNLGGASIGPQIGINKTDYIMLFMNDDGVKGLLQDKFELGADAAIAAGPVGRTASVGTNATFDSPILSYSRSRGAFIGVALKGAVITADDDLNRSLYTKTAKDILLRDANVAVPQPVQIFPQTLTSFSPRTAQK